MNDFTLRHLQTWVADNYPDQPNVEFDIRDFVADYPDVLDRLGWPEILELAKRQTQVSAEWRAYHGATA